MMVIVQVYATKLLILCTAVHRPPKPWLLQGRPSHPVRPSLRLFSRLGATSQLDQFGFRSTYHLVPFVDLCGKKVVKGL